MDDAVRDYVAAIAPEHRPLFDRVHRLILEMHPDAAVVLSYQMPTYKVGRRRLYVGVWKHGVSFYGWEEGRDAGFTARHPELTTGKGTIRLRPEDAAGIADDELHTSYVRPSTTEASSSDAMDRQQHQPSLASSAVTDEVFTGRLSWSLR